MSAAILEEKMPVVWAEDGKAISFYDFFDGYFIKVSLRGPDCANSSKTTFFGIYRGIKKTDCGLRLVLETEGDRLIANTAGRMCESTLKEFYLKNVQLVEVLARDSHAVLAIFHALGVSEVYRKNYEERIKTCLAHLKNMSGLNFISPY